MATGGMLAERANMTSDELQTEVRADESFADQVCIYSAMVGVVCGVIAGALLGHSTAITYPEVLGALGGVFGGVLAAVTGQCILLPAWIAHERKNVQPGLTPVMALKETATPNLPESPVPTSGIANHPNITASSPAGD